MGKIKYIKTSITLYGLIEENDTLWLEWYNYSKLLTSKLGYNPNYIGVRSESFKSGKVITVKRSESKLIKVLESGERPQSLDVYCLHDNFVQAVFDYYTSFSRIRDFGKHNVTITMPQEKFYEINTDEIINELKKYIKFSHGEIYELDYTECPILYIYKGKPISKFMNFNLIKEF